MTKILAATLVVATVTVAAVAWTAGTAHADGLSLYNGTWNEVTVDWTPSGNPAAAEVEHPDFLWTPVSPVSRTGNGDGVVDGADFLTWQRGYGR